MLKTVVWCCVLGILCIVATEGVIRVEDRLRHGIPLLSPYRGLGDLQVTDSLGAHARPRAQFGKWALDSFGLRNPPVPTQPSAGTVRVVVAGASETFGLYESPGQEFPAQLRARLQIAFDRAGCQHRVEVLNSAFAGMSLPTITQDVRLRLARLHPAVILYYPTPAQYLEESPPEPTRPSAAAKPRIPAWAPLWPRLLGRLRNHAKALIPGVALTAFRRRDLARSRSIHEEGWVFRTLPPERLDLFTRDLRELVGAIREIGAKPLLATHTNAFVGNPLPDPAKLDAWARFYPRAEGSVLLAFDSAAAVVVRRVAADSAVPLADLRASLRSGQGPSERFADFAHFTDLGASLASQRLSESMFGMLATWSGCAGTGARSF